MAEGHDRRGGFRGWLSRLDVARASVVKAGTQKTRQAAGTIHQVAVQGLQKARATGAQMARRIVSLQKMAGATDKMIEQSARSVQGRAMTRDSDKAWQAAYVREAARLGVRKLEPRASRPPVQPSPGPRDRAPQASAQPKPAAAKAMTPGPQWPPQRYIAPAATDREAGQ